MTQKPAKREILELLGRDAAPEDLELNIKAIRSETFQRDVALAGSIVTKQLILDELFEIYKMCKAAEPVLDRDGTPSGYMKFESRSAIKCLELLGKEVGMFRGELLPTTQLKETEEVKALATHLTNLMTKGSDRRNVIDTTHTRREDESGDIQGDSEGDLKV